MSLPLGSLGEPVFAALWANKNKAGPVFLSSERLNVSMAGRGETWGDHVSREPNSRDDMRKPVILGNCRLMLSKRAT